MLKSPVNTGPHGYILFNVSEFHAEETLFFIWTSVLTYNYVILKNELLLVVFNVKQK